MELASHTTALVTGQTGSVVHGHEIHWEQFGLNACYLMTVSGVSKQKLAAAAFRQAAIHILGRQQSLRYEGELQSLQQTCLRQDEFEFKLVFGCSLHRLQNSARPHYYVDKTLEEILKELLHFHGIKAEFYLSDCAYQIPYAAHGAASDYDFLLRLCIEHGVVFYYHSNEGALRLYFTTDQYHSVAHQACFNPGNGMVDDKAIISALDYFTEHLPDRVCLRGAAEQSPTRIFDATTTNQTDIPGHGMVNLSHVFVLNSSEACRRHADTLQKQLDWQREWLRIETNLFPVEAGDRILIAGHPNPRVNQLYRVLQVNGSANARIKSTITHPVRQTIWLIAIEHPYCMPHQSTRLAWQPVKGIAPEGWQRPVHYPKPGLETAVIHKQNGRTMLDETGRYLVQPVLGQKQSAAMPPLFLRLLHIAAGPARSVAWGMHMPLQPGTRVIMAHFHHLLDKPFILGVLPCTQQQKDVVNLQNSEQLVMRHHAGSTLLLDSQKGRQNIKLHTIKPEHGLFFHSTEASESIRVNSIENMQASSYEDLNIHTGQILQIENQSAECIAEKELSLVSQQSLAWQAKNNIKYVAGENWQLRSVKGRFELQAKQKIKAEGAALYLQANAFAGEARHLHAQAGKELDLHSQGILLQTGAAKVQLSDAGLLLNAPHLTIVAQQVIKNLS